MPIDETKALQQLTTQQQNKTTRTIAGTGERQLAVDELQKSVAASLTSIKAASLSFLTGGANVANRGEYTAFNAPTRRHISDDGDAGGIDNDDDANNGDAWTSAFGGAGSFTARRQALRDSNLEVATFVCTAQPGAARLCGDAASSDTDALLASSPTRRMSSPPSSSSLSLSAAAAKKKRRSHVGMSLR
jgi:hypothetical protein